MKISKILIVVLCGAMTTVVISKGGQTKNQYGNLLNRQAKQANLKDVKIGQAVMNALMDAGAPGGVVTVTGCTEDVTHSFTPGDSSLRGVLDSIVSTDPRYRWELTDHLVNVIPSNGLPPFFKVRMAKFDVRKAETPNTALFELLAVPEVRQAKLNLGRHGVQGGVHVFCPGCPPPKTKKISVNLKGVTVREALNAIARADGSAVWRFSQRECGAQKSFSLEFSK